MLARDDGRMGHPCTHHRQAFAEQQKQVLARDNVPKTGLDAERRLLFHTSWATHIRASSWPLTAMAHRMVGMLRERKDKSAWEKRGSGKRRATQPSGEKDRRCRTSSALPLERLTFISISAFFMFSTKTPKR